MQRGVRGQAKKKEKKDGPSPWVMAGEKEESAESEEEIVIAETPESAKPAMRVNIHANKDCEPLSTILVLISPHIQPLLKGDSLSSQTQCH